MSQHEVTYKTRNKIYNFLLDEFLNADDKTLSLIVRHYYKHYGNGPGDYLRNTYYSWKKGYTGISSLTFGRVIDFMPLYLTDEKRFIILKSEIESFVENLTNTKQSKIALSEINSRFIDLQNKILDFNKDDLQWFVGKNIFTNDLIEHYLTICKYVLNQKLIQVYRSFTSDLLIIKNNLYQFNQPIELAEYDILFLNQTVNIASATPASIEIIELKTLNFNLDDSFKKFGQEYFLNELMKISFNEKQNTTHSEIMSSDINLFFTQFAALKSNTKSQISMKSTFKGIGGNFRVNLEFIPINLSQTFLLKSILKFVTLCVITFSVIGSLFLFPVVWIFIVGGLAYLIPMAYKQFKNINLARQQIKKYGKQSARKN